MNLLKIWQKRFNQLDIALILLSLSGFLFTLYFWFPGSLSPDSMDSWDQAKTGNYRNDHPTIMAVVWKGLEFFSHGPSNMLVFHLLIVWGALLLIAIALKKELGWFTLGIPGVGLFPSAFGIEGVIWKDVGLGGTLLLAMAFLLVYALSFKRLALVGALLCLVYAINVRHNGMTACIPFAFLIESLVTMRSQQKVNLLRRLFYVSLILLGVKGSYSLVEKLAVRPENMAFEQNLFFVDLTALSIDSHQDLVLEEFKAKPYTEDEISKVYQADARCSDGLTYGGFMQIRKEPHLKARILSDWMKNIIKHPFAYLAHRTRYFMGLLGYGLGPCRSYHLFWDEKFGTADPTKNELRNYVDTLLAKLDSTPILRPWLYLLMSFVGLWFLIPVPPGLVKTTAAVLFTSGILYFLPYFFISVCCDFRYAWWLVISSVLGVLILVAKSLRSLWGCRFGRKSPSSF